MKFTIYLTAAIALSVLMASPAAGSLLTNGDFESWTDGDPDSWTLFATGGANEVAGLDGIGSAAALTKGGDVQAQVRQALSATLADQFEMSYDFAVDTSGVAAGDPATQTTLRDDSGAPYINLRVYGDGSLYMRGSGGFTQLAGSAGLIDSSDFDSNLINAYKVTIAGNLGVDFDVTLIDLSDNSQLGMWTDLSLFQKDPSSEGSGYIAEVFFDPGRGNVESGNWRVDNVSVAVPEPATMALLAAGGLAVLRRRRKA